MSLYQPFREFTIEFWEYAVMFFYLVVLFSIYGRIKLHRQIRYPEYRWFTLGLMAKIAGGLGCSLIYYYYYGSGDTSAYFHSAVCLSKLLFYDPKGFFIAWLGDNTLEHREIFTLPGWKPYAYMYTDDRQYMVSRIVAPLAILGLNSYVLTTVMVATISFTGVWKCYRMFVSYFPRLHKQLAIAVLFMPSSALWGSGILKDAITFSAACWLLSSVDQLWFKGNKVIGNAVAIVVCCVVIIWIKPYIFMVLLPVCFLWMSYARIARIRNALLKFIVLPLGLVAMSFVAFVLLNALKGSFDKFSLDSALEQIISTQKDLAYNTEYGDNKFDVGELDGTWSNLLSKWPVAVTAALFRPALMECNNFVMYMAGVENFFVLLLFIRVLWRTQVIFFISATIANPLLLVCFVFTFLYGFITGITTPNFGALVRFKIPLIPLFMSGMYILLFMMEQRRLFRNKGLTFRFKRYRNGDPDALPPRQAQR